MEESFIFRGREAWSRFICTVLYLCDEEDEDGASRPRERKTDM